MADELKCRRATLSDKTAVVNIISAYDGGDYMPSHYGEMIQHPSFVGVLGELHGDVVAFAGAYIINGGTTMMTKGSRVKEELQGRGVYGKLWRYLRDTIRDQAPGLKYEEFTVDTLNPLLQLPESKQKFTEVQRTPIKLYVVRKDVTNKCLSGGKDAELFGLDSLRQILADKEVTASLFPSRLLINWHIYLPVVENVDVIQAFEAHMSRTISGTAYPAKKTRFVVFGSWCECKDHLAYNLDMYGSVDDPKDVANHLQLHAKKAITLFSGEIRFTVVASPDLLNTIDKACSLLRFSAAHFNSTHVVTLMKEI